MSGKPSVSPKQIMNLVERQNYRCALSGRELTPETASLDHVLPLSRGGLHDISNVQVLNYQVNTAKGTLTVDEFISMCRDVVDYTERSDPDLEAASVPFWPGG